MGFVFGECFLFYLMLVLAFSVSCVFWNCFLLDGLEFEFWFVFVLILLCYCVCDLVFGLVGFGFDL